MFPFLRVFHPDFQQRADETGLVKWGRERRVLRLKSEKRSMASEESQHRPPSAVTEIVIYKVAHSDPDSLSHY